MKCTKRTCRHQVTPCVPSRQPPRRPDAQSFPVPLRILQARLPSANTLIVSGLGFSLGFCSACLSLRNPRLAEGTESDPLVHSFFRCNTSRRLKTISHRFAQPHRLAVTLSATAARSPEPPGRGYEEEQQTCWSPGCAEPRVHIRIRIWRHVQHALQMRPNIT